MDMARVLDRLYSGDPSRFVATRTTLARQARAEGDRELARQIDALRRPTRAAWLVNLLARSARKELTDVFELGAVLAALHLAGTPQEIQAVNGRRRRQIAMLMVKVLSLAMAEGYEPSNKTLDDVELCLQAGLAHPQAAAEILKGCLVKTPATAADFPLELFEAAALGLAPQELGRPQIPLSTAGQPGAVDPGSEAGDQRAAATTAGRLAPVISLAEARRRHAPSPAPPLPVSPEESPESEVESLAMASVEAGVEDVAATLRAEREREAALAQRLAETEREAAAAAEAATSVGRRVEQLAAELAVAQAERDAAAQASRQAQQRRDTARQEHEMAQRRAQQTEAELHEARQEKASLEAVQAMLLGREQSDS
ncbi:MULTISPECIES: hypothetical protein [unclassified Luteococcus]|uniref:hypothetical protein n=1 Tax=unclassified Luteococcus TaxID=2639923 RepID=UPI00313DB984